MNSPFKDTGIMLGVFCVFMIVVVGILAPWIAPHDPNSQVLEFRHKPPGFKSEIIRFRYKTELPEVTLAVKRASENEDMIIITDELNRKIILKRDQVRGGSLKSALNTMTFWLGTDQFGRDILSRVIYGARISLVVGFSASVIALLLGVLLGAWAGMQGGKVDILIMRFTDIMFGFPTLLFLIGITAAVDPSLTVVFIAIGMVTWPGIARLVRGQVLQLKELEYIQSAKTLGFSKKMIMLNHMLPNIIAPIIVTFSLGIAGAIMAEASLSFLGLGAQPPTPSWGAMINSSKDFLRIAPWSSMAPGIAIAIAVLGFNLLGDSIRDYFDPQMRRPL